MVKENVGGAPQLCKQIESADEDLLRETAKAVVDEPPWVPQGTSRDVLPAKSRSHVTRLACEPSRSKNTSLSHQENEDCAGPVVQLLERLAHRRAGREPLAVPAHHVPWNGRRHH